MSRFRNVFTTLGLGLWVTTAAADATRNSGPPGRVSPPLLPASVDSRSFGTEDRSVTVVPAARFRPPYMSPNLSAFCPPDSCTGGYHWYANLDLPAGTVIDYVGVNSATTVEAAMGFTLHFRDHLGGTAQLLSVSLPAHGFSTDLYGPLNILVPSNHDRVFVLDMELAPGQTDYQFFGFVEVWWRRVVSDPPATPTFGDVPTSHPFYRFIEALGASGITGGCGNGNFCPDNPLTRGQMAVFLSKALGLHWPN